MSLGARATKGGAKGKGSQDKNKPDKPQPKEKSKPQATTEQLRMANMIDRKSTDDGADVRKMVQDLMEMTCRTEEEVCSALHDTDNDVVAACNLLLEAEHTVAGEWQTQTNEKKKKKPPAAANNGEAEVRERAAVRGAGRGGGEVRGRGGGGRGARARARGRGGLQRARPRRQHHHHWGDHGQANQLGDTFPATEDWDNEEWSGSLSDTKVFTPSASAQAPPPDAEPAAAAPPAEEWEASPAVSGADHLPTYTYHSAAHHNIEPQLNSGSRGSPAAPADHPPDHFMHHAQPMGMSGSLSAAQSQYLSQLTAQSQYSPYVYGSPAQHAQPAQPVQTAPHAQHADLAPRKGPRPRVPPPSKIPSSAVEMPGGEGCMFLDVQFGALDPDQLQDTKHQSGGGGGGGPEPAPEPEPAPADTHAQTPQLNDSLSSETSSTQPPPAPEPPTTVANGVGVGVGMLEKQLVDTMKQLGVADTTHHHYVQRNKPAAVVSQASQSSSQASSGAPAAVQAAPHHTQHNVYAHHPVTHHPPPLYSANVYAPQQGVNSTSASLSSGMSAAYPSSVTLTQYQPIMNSYQQTSASAAGGYSSSALYTGYQPHHHKHHKDTQPQYETTSVASASNSLTSTSTTQTSTAKVATTTASVSGGAGVSGVSGGGAGGAGGAGGGYAGGALYGSAYYEELRSLPSHGHALVSGVSGPYYEVGYSREFPLGGERFARGEAASPQQVAGALPPGYAYFYQAPPTTYQYGMYPYSGKGYQQQYEGEYKGAAGVYSPAQPKPAPNATAPDITNAMYAKGHVALNKVNSYEKAAFHSGTPPPFGAASHLYIPAPPHHHHHAPNTHQMDVRMTVQNSSQNRRESGSAGGRPNTSKPAHSKPTYSHSYWPPN